MGGRINYAKIEYCEPGMTKHETAVSLFCGAGGMDVGFSKAGFQTVWANDLDRNACDTYAANHGDIVHQGDLTEKLPQLKAYSGVDVVYGGPPCQGFSVAGKMDPNDPRSQLVFTFMKAVKIVRPRAFVCENVKALGLLEKWRPVREELVREAVKLGYHCSLVVLKAVDFGVPQARERMFLVGFREGAECPEQFNRNLNKTKRKAKTVREVVLPLGRAGTTSNSRICAAKVTIASTPVLRKSPYAGMLFNGQGRPLNPDGYASTLPASMGGNRTPIIDEAHLFDGEPSWVEEYHARLMKGGRPLPFDAAPPRLRRLTIDEALRLQTFPSQYKFLGRQSSVFSQIGNAVPCQLAAAVGTSVLNVLRGTFSLPASSDQLRLAV